MKTQSPIFSSIPTAISNKKISALSPEKVADTIIDSFNEQTQLNNHFKLRIKKMIDSIEYAYPNEGVKLKEIIDTFSKESKKLSGDYMKKLLDTHLAFNPININNRNSANSAASNVVIPKHNKNWMKDWMEQADNYNNNPEALALISNNIEGFLHYADIVEGKYV